MFNIWKPNDVLLVPFVVPRGLHSGRTLQDVRRGPVQPLRSSPAPVAAAWEPGPKGAATAVPTALRTVPIMNPPATYPFQYAPHQWPSHEREGGLGLGALGLSLPPPLAQRCAVSLQYLLHVGALDHGLGNSPPPPPPPGYQMMDTRGCTTTIHEQYRTRGWSGFAVSGQKNRLATCCRVLSVPLFWGGKKVCGGGGLFEPLSRGWERPFRGRRRRRTVWTCTADEVSLCCRLLACSLAPQLTAQQS